MKKLATIKKQLQLVVLAFVEGTVVFVARAVLKLPFLPRKFRIRLFRIRWCYRRNLEKFKAIVKGDTQNRVVHIVLYDEKIKI